MLEESAKMVKDTETRLNKAVEELRDLVVSIYELGKTSINITSDRFPPNRKQT